MGGPRLSPLRRWGRSFGHGDRLLKGERNIPSRNLPKVADIGLTHKEVHKARVIRDAEILSRPVAIAVAVSGAHRRLQYGIPAEDNVSVNETDCLPHAIVRKRSRRSLTVTSNRGFFKMFALTVTANLAFAGTLIALASREFGAEFVLAVVSLG